MPNRLLTVNAPVGADRVGAGSSPAACRRGLLTAWFAARRKCP